MCHLQLLAEDLVSLLLAGFLLLGVKESLLAAALFALARLEVLFVELAFPGSDLVVNVTGNRALDVVEFLKALDGDDALSVGLVALAKGG